MGRFSVRAQLAIVATIYQQFHEYVRLLVLATLVLEDRRYSFYDHYREHYASVRQLKDNRHTTEFGDDY